MSQTGGSPPRGRRAAWGLVLVLVAALASGARAEDGAASATERELARTRRELARLEQRLSAEQAATQRRLEELQRQLQAQAELIERLQGQLAATTAAASGTPPASGVSVASAPAVAETEPPPAAPLEAAAVAARPWSPEQPIRLLGSAQAYVNLSLDTLVDLGWSTTPDVTELELGDHDPNQRGFALPNTELVLDGAVDPYFKGLATVVFHLDENNETQVELEESYLLSTALPWNLQLKGGQFLAEFGRQNQQHPHSWDFVDVPLVLARILGPEGLRNPGARVSWLVPTPFYSEVFLTMLDSQGETAASFRDEDAPQFGRTPVATGIRSLGDLLYVPRYVASVDLTPSQTLVAGASGAFGPNATGSNTDTQVYGVDLYWKWKPEWQSAGWPFVSLQSEGLYRRFEAGAGPSAEDPSLLLPRESLHDYGFYAQALYGFTRRWVAGVRGEYVSGEGGAFRANPAQADRFRLSPDLTFYPSEFSKLRLQGNYDHGQAFGDEYSFWLQTEFLLGAHAAHKF